MVGPNKKQTKQYIKRFSFGLLPLVILTAGFWLPIQFAPKVLASSECNVDSLNPENPPVNNDTGFDFDVSDSLNDIQWASITAPSSQLMLYDGFSPDLVSSNITSNQAVFYNGDVSAGVDTDLHVDVQIGNYFSPSDWTVQVSSDPNGANPVTCGGQTAIDVSDTTPPNLSSVTATVLSNSATISWQTDKLADSQVLYGLTSNYGKQQTNSSYTTSHSIKLSSLAANTTYHYEVVSTDEAGNVTSSSDNTFTSPMATTNQSSGSVKSNSSSSTASSTVTAVTAPVSTLEPAVTNVSDTTPPTIQLSTKLTNPYKATPVFSGTASDKVSVARVEYSTDDGRDWLPVDSVTDLNGPAVSFNFTPVNLDDGTYQIMVRATNAGGKTSVSPVDTLVIDRIPPNVGGDVISVGTQILDSDNNGDTTLPASVEAKLSLDAVGGPTKVNIIATNVSSKKSSDFALLYNPYNDLWQGNMEFKTPGNYTLASKAVNGVDQEVDRTLNNITVEPAGQVLGANNKPINATVTVYDRDPVTDTWTEWDGTPYGQVNPYVISGNAGYSFLLPAGTYYLKVNSSNYHSATSNSFTVSKLTDIASNFKLDKSLGLAGINLPLPNLSTTPLSASGHIAASFKTSPALNQSLPAFNLPLTNGQALNNVDLLGKPTILTFIATWAPPAQDQLSILNKLDSTGLNVVPVGIGQSSEELAVYNNIGNYSLPVLVDTDQQLVRPLNLNTLPTTYFVNRQGVVKKVMVGVLSRDELMNNLEY